MDQTFNQNQEKQPEPEAMSQAALVQLILAQQEKINHIYVSVEKARKIFLWTIILTIAMVVIPMIILAFIFPTLSNTFTGGVQNLGL